MEFIHSSKTLASVSSGCVVAVDSPKTCGGFPHFRSPLPVLLIDNYGSEAVFHRAFFCFALIAICLE